MVAPRELGTHPLGHDQYFFASYATVFKFHTRMTKEKKRQRRFDRQKLKNNLD